MTDLPPGWESTTLGEVCSTGSGGTPRAGTPEYYGGDIPWVVIGDLNDSMVNSTNSTITKEGLERSAAVLIPPGSVLMAMYGSIGKLGVAGMELATNQAIVHFRQSPAIEMGFLFRFLMTVRKSMATRGKGATQQNISQTIVRAWPLPLPPLAEQLRITEVVDDILSDLDAADSALRAAVRKSRDMTEATREHWLRSVPSRLMRLEDVLEGIEAGRSFGGAAPPAGPQEWGVVKVSAMTWGVFDETQNKRIDPNAADVRYEIRSGDLLISRANTVAYVGAPVLVDGVREKLLLSDKSLRLKSREEVDKRWLLHALASRTFRSYVSKTATGNQDSMRNISQAALRAAPIHVPTPSDQRLIANKIEESLRDQSHIRTVAEQAISRSIQVRSAALNDAFKGRLGTTDLRDEPASVILDRLRAERSALAATSRRRAHKIAGARS